MDISKFLKRNSSLILTIAEAAGMVATVFLAVKATPKALMLIEEQEHQDNDEPTTAEAVKACWTCYIPAAIAGAATLTCMFGGYALNRHQQAALASACTLVSHRFYDYKNKVKELYGEEVHERIISELAAEKAEKIHLTGSTFWSSNSLDFENAEEKRVLFCFQDRFFESTFSQVLQAEYHLNRNYALGCTCTLNMFYEFLGIHGVPGGNIMIFDPNSYDVIWIDFNHSHHTKYTQSGERIEYYIIEPEFDLIVDNS